MKFPRLYNALNAYCRYLQSELKGSVQVRTGALRNSIKVRCEVNDQLWSMSINLNNYWKWLREPIPMDEIYDAAGIPRPVYPTKYPRSSGLGTRYKLDLNFWQGYLDDAYKQDIMMFVYEGLKKSGLEFGDSSV